MLEAETQAATFQQNAIAAQAAVTRMENALKTLILPDRSSPLWSTALRPTTTSTAESPIESVEAAVRRALANRPELKQSQVAAATNQAETAFFRDQRKPQVDLVASYLSSGLAGRLKPAGPNPLTLGTQPLIDRLNTLSAAQGLPADFGIDRRGLVGARGADRRMGPVDVDPCGPELSRGGGRRADFAAIQQPQR